LGPAPGFVGDDHAHGVPAAEKGGDFVVKPPQELLSDGRHLPVQVTAVPDEHDGCGARFGGEIQHLLPQQRAGRLARSCLQPAAISRAPLQLRVCGDTELRAQRADAGGVRRQAVLGDRHRADAHQMAERRPAGFLLLAVVHEHHEHLSLHPLPQ